MIRRLSIVPITLMVILLCPAFESQTANAQGLLRRLRDRIQSRRVQTPPYQPQTRSQSPTYGPRTPAQDGVQRVQPQRSSPANPSSAATGSPTRATAPTPAKGSRVTGSADQTASKASGYGGSILSSGSASQRAEDSAPNQAKPKSDAEGSGGTRPSLGIRVRPNREGIPGLSVAGFRDDSLADEAGLKEGDVILAVEGKATPTVADITQLLDGWQRGNQVRAKVLRGKKTMAITIPLLPASIATTDPAINTPEQVALTEVPVDLGIELTDSEHQRGVVVSKVAADSPAAAAGLKVGDRIVSIDGRLMYDRRMFDRELASREIGKPLTLRLVRENRLVATDIQLVDVRSFAKSAGSDTAKTVPSAERAGGSVVEGIGSMLGGLFGGKPKAAKTDEMAFGDDEPIERVIFESEVNQTTKQLESDPPSLEKLDLPPGEASPIESSDSERIRAKKRDKQNPKAEQLREEIRQLEQRLKELESKP